MEKVLDSSYVREKKPSGFFQACHDLRAGMVSFPVAGRLAWQEIKLRYKRSTLGPFWITLSTMIMIYFMGLVYANLLGIDLKSFFPYIAAGMMVWQFFLALALEGLDGFIESGAMIRQVAIPFSIYIYKVMYRNLIVLGHQMVGLIPIFLYYRVVPNFPALFLGIALVMGTLFFLTLLLSMVGSRYRDVKPIVSSVLGVVFFVTPVLWMPEMLTGRKIMLVKYNPIYHMINLIRQPLLGQQTPQISYFMGLLFLFGLGITSLLIFGKYRRRIPFWV